MIKQPTISVLLAVYNTPFQLVKRAINSVLQQDMQDFEMIIIDDGSDVEYHQELARFTALFPSAITYIRHPNCGQSQSINRGIVKSRGKYIAIVDADDELKKNHLSSCLLEMKSADLIASTTETIVDDETDYYVPDKSDSSKLIHVDDCILFATLFGKKEVFLEHRFYSMYAADANFYERAARKYNVKKVDLRTYIYYRNIPNSICATVKKNMLLGSAN